MKKRIIFVALILLLYYSGCSLFNSPSWEEVDIETQKTITKIHFVDKDVGFLVTDGGEIFKFKNGKWNELTNPDTTNSPLYDIASYNGNVYICGGDSIKAIVLKGQKDQDTISIMSEFSGNSLAGITVLDTMNIWTCGGKKVYKYNETGFAVIHSIPEWRLMKLIKIYALSQTRIFVLGEGLSDTLSYLFKCDNGEWSELSLNMNQKFYDIFFLNRSTGYIVGQQMSVFYYTGSAFAKDNSFPSYDIPFYAIHRSDINSGYIVGGIGSGLNTIIYSFDQGTWQKEEGIKNAVLKTVYSIDRNDVWTGGDNGKLFHKH